MCGQEGDYGASLCTAFGVGASSCQSRHQEDRNVTHTKDYGASLILPFLPFVQSSEMQELPGLEHTTGPFFKWKKIKLKKSLRKEKDQLKFSLEIRNKSRAWP